MNRRFGFKKTDHIVTNEADHAALEMRYLLARNKAKFGQNSLQIGERVRSAVFGYLAILLASC